MLVVLALSAGCASEPRPPPPRAPAPVAAVSVAPQPTAPASVASTPPPPPPPPTVTAAPAMPTGTVVFHSEAEIPASLRRRLPPQIDFDKSVVVGRLNASGPPIYIPTPAHVVGAQVVATLVRQEFAPPGCSGVAPPRRSAVERVDPDSIAFIVLADRRAVTSVRAGALSVLLEVVTKPAPPPPRDTGKCLAP